ncbi:hypothetical protein GS636_14040 [Ruegeria sp. HKCCD4884]|uniref:SGNH/GDSL hydrolase family protein n=1 Tax=Ruegeria sp. HKCCD4884 TaxID=2683022 RepID=UPI001492E3AE|nr:SGNH/GDSL hydrolase family protein [Ruegeria sp. HKCCD4884]NOD93906.1 hypothetical protein [Ruegeria sp. HKCCD4884]
MKKQMGIQLLLLTNLLLFLTLTAVLIKTGYLSKTIRKFSGASIPVTETNHYKRMVWLHERPTSQALASPDIQIAFIGDSIIEGWLTSNVVKNSLNLGISRDTTPGLIARVNPELIAHIPVWYLAIGVNDAMTNTPLEEVPGFVAQLADTFAPANTLIWSAVLPVKDATWTPENEAFRSAFNAAAQQACANMKTCTFLAPPLEYGDNVRDWTSDGLHPNALGYAHLAQQLCAHVPCQSNQP